MKKIVILTADAGFGHRSAAKALAATLENYDRNEIQVEVVNLLDNPETPSILRNSQTDYDKVVRDMPKIFEFGYEQTDKTVPTAIAQMGLSTMLYASYAKMVETHKPDLILNTYMLYHGPAQSWYLVNENLTRGNTDKKSLAVTDKLVSKKKRSKKHIPFVTVITDMGTVHMLWYSLLPDLYCVGSESTRKEAIDHGISEKNIAVTGIPISGRIAAETRSKTEIRQALGFDPELPLIFAIGSKRVTHILEYLNVINHAGFDVQIAMTAGGDESLYQSMLATEWHIPVKIYNFCNNIPEILLSSDLALTKAGGLITSECMAANLPMLMIDILTGQESENARLVEENHAGKNILSPIHFLETLYYLLQKDRSLINHYIDGAKILGKPNSSKDIIDLALKLLQTAGD